MRPTPTNSVALSLHEGGRQFALYKVGCPLTLILEITTEKRARDLQSERTLRGWKDDAIAILRLSEIAFWRQLISRRDTFSFAGPLI
jgi:hypothetical protein